MGSAQGAAELEKKMQATSKEHFDLMAQFEQTFKGRRLDRESKDMWAIGAVYQDGQTNELFKAYRLGYAHHKCIANLESA